MDHLSKSDVTVAEKLVQPRDSRTDLIVRSRSLFSLFFSSLADPMHSWCCCEGELQVFSAMGGWLSMRYKMLLDCHQSSSYIQTLRCSSYWTTKWFQEMGATDNTWTVQPHPKLIETKSLEECSCGHSNIYKGQITCDFYQNRKGIQLVYSDILVILWRGIAAR